MHNVLWWYAAYRARLTSAALSVEKRRALTLTWLTGPVLYGVAVAVAFFDHGVGPEPVAPGLRRGALAAGMRFPRIWPDEVAE